MKYKSPLFITLLLTLLTGCIFKSKQIRIKEDNTVEVKFNKSYLHLQAISNNIIRVHFYPAGAKNDRPSLSVINPKIEDVKWKISQKDNILTLSTLSLKALVDIKSGNIVFTDSSGNLILREKERNCTTAVVLDENTYNVEQKFELSSKEALYGLGQHQDSVMNWRGKSVDLFQLNREVSVPVLVSSNGYGILWDNTSLTKFKDDDKGMQLWSEVGDGIDYYFINGKNIDEVIAGYRQLTGQAPLFGKWGYGFVQCKERYNTQEEVINTLKEFRKREVPIDMIVQDWFYWVPKPWGSHYFDPKRYPNPAEMTKEVHKLNAKIMISVWAKFDSTSNNYEELNKNNLLFKSTSILQSPKTQYYDPYNPEGRKIYWKQVRDSFFVKGFDAWWLDASEPEMSNSWTKDDMQAMNGYLGTGARYFNAYPLMHTTAVYQGQRSETSDKRVFILTRSAFTGQQRNAAVTWSGDIIGNWNVFRRQISAGLNFCFSGIPYWTTDIGGFFVNVTDGCKDPAYQELFTRWYQFGAFCPVFRVHGTNTPREIWQFGDKGSWVYGVQLKYDNLRYRLMPYIYSTAWKVTSIGYTMMRGLAFDFPKDEKVLNIDDQFMFGQAFLVNPVTSYMYYTLSEPDPGKTIPSSVLYTTDGKQGGLTADYFDGMAFEKKITSKTDSLIDFNWADKAPLDKMPSDYFSVRWTGKIKAEETGNYTFISTADDGTRLRVNGKLLIDDWNAHATESHTGTINLEKGKLYNIVFEYYENQMGANVKLGWSPPSQQKKTKEILPEKSRSVYLPAAANWIDFWTGKTFTGGQSIKTPAPIETMPLFVKQGSVVPMGPFIQYTTEKPADPIELRIYPGADGQFILYEDENDNYNYEKGKYSTIEFMWNDRQKTLTVSDRKGEFPGMLKERSFNIVLVKENHGTGLEICTKPDRTVKYSGTKLEIKL